MGLFCYYEAMWILDVIPLAKGAGAKTLSYFTGKNVVPGMVVLVPLRGKTVLGLVAVAKEASEERAALRGSSYRLKKVSSVLGESIWSQAYLEAARNAAEFYVSSLGEIISQIVPAVVFEKYKEFKNSGPAPKKIPAEFKPEKFVFQRELEERLDYYKTLVRTEFAKNLSVYLCLPTSEEVERFAEDLSRGIKAYVYVLHGRLGKKELLKRLYKLGEDKHPVLIVGTPYFLFVRRDDVETLIIEHESSSAYRTISRPYIDFRVFAELLAAAAGQKIIFADTFLQTETLYREEMHELLELVPIKWRIQASQRVSLVDTRKKEVKRDGIFTLMSEDALGAIREALSRGKNILVYAARRGLHPLTICRDCGTTLVCPHCQATLVLHGQSGIRKVFICHKCGNAHDADLPCAHCGGWRLAPLGYGTESVEGELSLAFPGVKIARLDRDAATTPSRARKIAESFERATGNILVGTEMALYYLGKPIDTVIVASIDSLFSLPSFRIQEKIFHTLLSLRTRSEKVFILQTRLSNKEVIEQLLDGDLVNFYRNELRERKTFRYPPFVRLIKLSIQGKKPALDIEAAAIKELLKSYEPESFSAFISKVKNLYRTNIVLRLDPKLWPLPGLGQKEGVDPKIRSLLKVLSPAIAIRVEPEDLL